MGLFNLIANGIQFNVQLSSYITRYFLSIANFLPQF
jgi:hypothetical protein